MPSHSFRETSNTLPAPLILFMKLSKVSPPPEYSASVGGFHPKTSSTLPALLILSSMKLSKVSPPPEYSASVGGFHPL
ncbi:hypothetical protein JTE90_008191 [Oedothorax gibbosus]|uniref:Uncharacterized protein n=1 Tax=Oedothorax gibbosus TaxID=931172 RepID=A0AAV6VGG0_9ARAC|nr:hypothetical protein JTE90_008191 [Oedothorax gibbosus]